MREAGPPPAAERAAILAEEGPDAIDERPGASPGTTEIRVRWHQVPDFYGSSGRSRHYVLDRLGGTVGFGDGVRGLIPPPGASNLLLTYASGGGAVGNRPAGTVSQLQTTVPSVRVGHQPPAGRRRGRRRDPDRPARRAGRGHSATAAGRWRSTTSRTWPASPRRGWRAPRRWGRAARARPAQVEVMLVAAGSDPRPAPTLELIDRVADYLPGTAHPDRRPPGARADLARRRGRGRPRAAGLDLGGGGPGRRAGRPRRLPAPAHRRCDGAGWDFGQRPHRSDLIALVEGLPGVDHVRHLAMAEAADGPILPGRFLVCSGDHRVTLVTDEEG